MKLQDIFVDHPQNSLEIRLVAEHSLQPLKLRHDFSDLTICIQKLIKNIRIFIGELIIR